MRMVGEVKLGGWMSPNNCPFLGLIITPLLKVLLILWATNLSPHLWWPWWPPCHAKLLKWCPLFCHDTMLLCFFPLPVPFPSEFSALVWVCKYIQSDGSNGGERRWNQWRMEEKSGCMPPQRTSSFKSLSIIDSSLPKGFYRMFLVKI